MQDQQKLQTYIYQQLQAGLSPTEIAQQLRGASWDENAITTAFSAVRDSITPPPTQLPISVSATSAQTTPLTPQPEPEPATINQAETIAASFEPTGKKRGRLKTAWLLLKQSMRVLINNKQLLHYAFVSLLMWILLAIVFMIIIVLGGDFFVYAGLNSEGVREFYFNGAGYVLMLVYYVLAYFLSFIYNAGLTANTLDIFRGKSESYHHYMKQAWHKKGTIFIYSFITATVGIILNFIEERAKFIGQIVSTLVGTAWALATMFTIPVILESELSSVAAIKSSTKLFVSRWGENVAARIAFGGIFFIFYIFVFLPVLFLTTVYLFGFGFGAVIIPAIIVMIIFITISSAASSILNTALYYFAQYQQIPAAFEADLLNASLVTKKPRAKLFGRGKSS